MVPRIAPWATTRYAPVSMGRSWTVAAPPSATWAMGGRSATFVLPPIVRPRASSTCIAESSSSSIASFSGPVPDCSSATTSSARVAQSSSTSPVSVWRSPAITADAPITSTTPTTSVLPSWCGRARCGAAAPQPPLGVAAGTRARGRSRWRAGRTAGRSCVRR